jgi:hypothetical protein
MKFDRFEIVFIIVMLIVAMLVMLMSTTLVQADDEGPLSITTDDDWYRKGEVIKYNITDTPDTKVHILVGYQQGEIKREIFGQTDENGTYTGVILTNDFRVGSWHLDVDDGNNNTARVKVNVVMDSGHIEDIWIDIGIWWRGYKAFLLEWFGRFVILVLLMIGGLAYTNSKRMSEMTGEPTLVDKIWITWQERGTIAPYLIGRSKRGKQDSHLMLKKKFNNLRRQVEKNESDMKWDIQQAKTFDDDYPNASKKFKKFVFKQLRTNIDWLVYVNSKLTPKMKVAQKDLINSYIRQGLWHEAMSDEERDALLYAGEERKVMYL